MAHPFRFTLQAKGPGDGPGLAAFARKAEGLGYDAITFADHFDEAVAPVPAAVAVADATSTLKVGWLVLCNDYRHPVVTAKEAATVDLLTGGRLVLGLGAGWMTTDYEQSGIALDRAGVRIDRLTEAITIIKGLLGPDTVDHGGAHYRISGMSGHPRPAQQPHPPVLIGGGGRRVLELAGREADIVGLNVNLAHGVIDARSYPNGTADATLEKVGWVRAAAAERGRDPILQTRVHLALVGSGLEDLVEELAPQFGLTPDQAHETPHALLGEVDKIVDDLERRRDQFGISMIGLSADTMEAMAPVVARLAGR